jgi:type IV pilus assembly protein PilO
MAINLSLNKMPWYGQVVLFAVLGLAGVGVFYYFYVMPFQTEMAEREQKLAALRADINKGMTTATKLADFRAQVTDLQTRLDGLKAVLPEEKDVADLLRRIQTLATQSNLSIKGFKPMATATKELHAEWPIALQLDGTYHNLGIFFDRISKFSRIINVGNIAIRAKEKPDANSTITAECTATTFVLIEQKPTPATPAAPAKK